MFNSISDNKPLLLQDLDCKTSINNDEMVCNQPKWKAMGSIVIFSIQKLNTGKRVSQGIREVPETGNSWMSNLKSVKPVAKAI